MEKSKYNPKNMFQNDAKIALEILRLVTEIAVAREGNETFTTITQTSEATTTQRIEEIDGLVRTLFLTMCELYQEAT